MVFEAWIFLWAHPRQEIVGVGLSIPSPRAWKTALWAFHFNPLRACQRAVPSTLNQSYTLPFFLDVPIFYDDIDVILNDIDVILHDIDVILNDIDVILNDIDVTLDDIDVILDDIDVILNDIDVILDDIDVNRDNIDVNRDNIDVILKNIFAKSLINGLIHVTYTSWRTKKNDSLRLSFLFKFIKIFNLLLDKYKLPN